ncbi:hypothetical protein GO986_17230 [Deinococcus sp. HMF7620]|uniref:Uncharacterized protein n=1 Tax=Deinococcus arboris TaxID=2682977 RepID=A0A7C9HTS3_9DEIO|nr:hypothetical protein [Deinococcus arboris]MVN88487.1 hypothetical protein [Deinococcus arboris]
MGRYGAFSTRADAEAYLERIIDLARRAQARQDLGLTTLPARMSDTYLPATHSNGYLTEVLSWVDVVRNLTAFGWAVQQTLLGS